MYLPKAVAPEVLAANQRTIEDRLASLRFFEPGRGQPTHAAQRGPFVRRVQQLQPEHRGRLHDRPEYRRQRAGHVLSLLLDYEILPLRWQLPVVHRERRARPHR